jgi:hypothetical protein
MGFFKKLRETSQSTPPRSARSTRVDRPDRPSWLTDGAPVTLYEGRETLACVGEANYQRALWLNVGGQTADRVRQDVVAILAPEPDNRHDSNAVSVWVGGWRVGYLARDEAAMIQPGLLGLMETSGLPVALKARIVGGGIREDGIGRLGVWLDYDPEDFGLPSIVRRVRAQAGAVRTGRSSDDRSWIDDLPEDQVGAVKQLRELLNTEESPLERHFMHSELFRRLYQLRDAFASVLDEFDVACEAHHQEIVTIRPALIEAFGGVPLIDFYKQAAIRCQKARM